MAVLKSPRNAKNKRQWIIGYNKFFKKSFLKELTLTYKRKSKKNTKFYYGKQDFTALKYYSLVTFYKC